MFFVCLLFTYLASYLFIYLSIYLFVYWFICIFIYLLLSSTENHSCCLQVVVELEKADIAGSESELGKKFQKFQRCFHHISCSVMSVTNGTLVCNSRSRVVCSNSLVPV